jgi:hypothetical protein
MARQPRSLPGPEQDFVIALDACQVDQVRRLALAWGIPPEQVITRLVSTTLGEWAADLVDLIPGPVGPITRGH